MPSSAGALVVWMAAHPWQILVRWNYKAAVLSGILRAALFFAVNLRVGPDAAVAAMWTEFCFRFVTAGFYGAITQAFRRVEPARNGTIAAMVVLPLVAHTLEFFVHAWRGTAALGTSIAASVIFTALSTAFNLFAMRRGALVVGEGERPLWSDLAAMPRLVVLFVGAAARGCLRVWV